MGGHTRREKKLDGGMDYGQFIAFSDTTFLNNLLFNPGHKSELINKRKPNCKTISSKSKWLCSRNTM